MERSPVGVVFFWGGGGGFALKKYTLDLIGLMEIKMI